MNITITDALQAEDTEEISNHLIAYNRKIRRLDPK